MEDLNVLDYSEVQHCVYDNDKLPSEPLGTFIDIQKEISDTLPPISENEDPSNYASQFPDIVKCVPRWKQIFPWVCWCSEDCALYCIQCRELLKKSFPDQIKKSNVILITSKDEIFTVAKTLRNHHNSVSHSAAIYLYCHSNLVSFVALFNNHYKDMKNEDDVLQTVRSMFNYSELNKEGFVMTIKHIGMYIENTLIDSVKNSMYFSVVADQCRGIIIVRWINEKGKLVEHVFWSYLSEFNMTPMQYLKKFDLDFDKMTLYVANSLCQQCSRCSNLSVVPASLPPRPPSTLSFANILWNLDFLRPLMSLVNTIYKLFKSYPFKFAKAFDTTDMKSLFNFSVNPVILIKIMENFESIKTVATEIYVSQSYVEALGLATVDLKNDEQHKKILNLLQEIIDTVKEASKTKIITEQQIVKLNQAFGSLKAWSAGASFITYGNQPSQPEENKKKTKSDKIWEFLYFVEKFIDENQKSIYYNGRDRVESFTHLCCLEVLLNESGTEIDESKLCTHFNTVFDVCTQVLKTTHAFEKMRYFRCIKNFYNHLLTNKLTVSTCVDIVKLFHKDTDLQKRFPGAQKIFYFCGTMPFQFCHIARSLFVSFVIEQRVETSVWTRMDADLKPWLLYLQNEFHIIPPQDLLLWWLRSMS